MSIRNTGSKRVRPIHPGEMLREDFLPDYALTGSTIADAIGVSRQTINEVLRERRAVSPQMALRLGRLFGNSPALWLNVQREVDLWDAARGHRSRSEPHQATRYLLECRPLGCGCPVQWRDLGHQRWRTVVVGHVDGSRSSTPTAREWARDRGYTTRGLAHAKWVGWVRTRRRARPGQLWKNQSWTGIPGYRAAFSCSLPRASL